MTIQDPTKAEMLSYLSKIRGAKEFDEFDREEAIYWFASEYHGGQGSNLYSALSSSEFRPGANASYPSDTADILYEKLEKKFTSDGPMS